MGMEDLPIIYFKVPPAIANTAFVSADDLGVTQEMLDNLLRCGLCIKVEAATAPSELGTARVHFPQKFTITAAQLWHSRQSPVAAP